LTEASADELHKMFNKPFTQAEVEDLLTLPEGVKKGPNDFSSARLFDLEGQTVREVKDSPCYMGVLTSFVHGEHGVRFFPKFSAHEKEYWSMPKEWTAKYFKMLRYVRLLDREHTDVSFLDNGLPLLTLKTGIDYTYVYMGGCFYRLAESHSDVTYRLTKLYYEARKRGIKFLQCFLYVLEEEAFYNWNHFFFPGVNRDWYRRAPAFGNAIWKLMRSSAQERAKLLRNREDGGVSEVIVRLHDELMGSDVISVVNPIDILHPSLAPIFVNTALTRKKFDKILADSPVETERLPERKNPYGNLRGFY
jgi:hypothetical protein